MDVAGLGQALEAEGVPPEVVRAALGYEWGNGPGDVYGAHRHDYDKVLLCLAGSILFGLDEAGSAVRREARLRTGERLDLPAGTLHDAHVGQDGVRCFELHLPAGTLAGRPTR